MHKSDNRIYTKKYTRQADNPLTFPLNEREVLRYCGYMGTIDEGEEQLRKLLDEVTSSVAGSLSYAVCYRELSLDDPADRKSVSFLFESAQVSKLLKDCSHVVLFAATIGMGIDLLINRNQRFSPAKALLLQGLGAERIEALCDNFCDEYKENLAKENYTTTPRYSPGYGDLPLEKQQDFFRVLDIYHQIGVSLGDNLFMKPSKSVTALFGIKKEASVDKEGRGGAGNKCISCDNTDCTFRKIETGNVD